MYKNPFWIVLLGLIAISSLFFLGKMGYSLYQYYRLDQRAPAEVVWSVHEESEDHFLIQGDYTYIVGNTSYQGSSFLRDSVYRNTWAAADTLKDLEGKRGRVWYDSSNPTYSSLQKTFPLKECLSTGFLLGLLLYFIGLGYYVQKRK